MPAKLLPWIILLAVAAFPAPPSGAAPPEAGESMVKIDEQAGGKAYFWGVALAGAGRQTAVRGKLALRRPGPLERLRGHVDITLVTGRGAKYSWRGIGLAPPGRYGKLSRPQFTAKRFAFTLPLGREAMGAGSVLTLTYHETALQGRPCL